MTDTTDNAGPGAAARFIHWTMAALILGLYVLGLAMDELARGAPRDFAMLLHQSFGLVLVALLAVRLAVRPAAARAGTRIERLAARAAHAALYALMAAVPLAGIATQWARGRALDFFGLVTLPSPMGGDRALAKLFGGIHETGATAILVVAAIHAAAALWHHFVRRDDVLRAMLPRRLVPR
ncbi:MAG: cytochrome b [Rhodospirillales bacterium]|nr:cytochrome b [Rhodospirillales bacterium]